LFKIQNLNKEGMKEGVKSKVSKVHEGYFSLESMRFICIIDLALNSFALKVSHL